VRSRTKSKDKVGPLNDSVGNVIDDDKGMCDMLNEFFGSFFTTENIAGMPEVNMLFNADGSQKLNVINIEPGDMYDKIMSLKDGKAPGDDGIIPEFLIRVACEISNPLAILYNKSVMEVMVPLEWKRANITPLFKRGSRSEPGNYRPVSLTSYLGKISEAVIKDDILHHLTVHSLPVINDSLHGFLAKRSCLTNLLEFLEHVTKAVDHGKPVDVIYLRFKTRSSADADNGLDAFSSQSRSTNMVPFSVHCDFSLSM